MPDTNHSRNTSARASVAMKYAQQAISALTTDKYRSIPNCIDPKDSYLPHTKRNHATLAARQTNSMDASRSEKAFPLRYYNSRNYKEVKRPMIPLFVHARYYLNRGEVRSIFKADRFALIQPGLRQKPTISAFCPG